MLHPTTSKEDSDIIIHRPSLPIISPPGNFNWCQYLWARGNNWYSYLLPAQFIVHLYPLHFFQTLLQSLVALPELSDVVTGFGQDASFALEGQRCRHRVEWRLSVEKKKVSGRAETSAYCSSLGAVHAAVRDDLGKRDYPVVDLVSSPPLDWLECRNKKQKQRCIKYSEIQKAASWFIWDQT